MLFAAKNLLYERYFCSDNSFARAIAIRIIVITVAYVDKLLDIIIPPTNTTSDSAPSKIPAGEKVLIIKTPKGVYIRTSHGKIFAVRTASKTGTTAASPTTTITSTTSQAIRKATPSTATRLTSTTVGFMSTVTGNNISHLHYIYNIFKVIICRHWLD